MDYIKYVFIALIGWGLWAIASKWMTRFFNTVSITFWISFWALVFLSGFLLYKKNLVVNNYVFFVAPVGFVTLIAMLSFYKALSIGPASVVVPFANMYVIFPVLFGLIVLKESITMTRIIGIIFAILATIFLSL
jgi:transporter family protein